MKVLITGISGKLGRMLAEMLMSQGHRVIGIDRRPWPDAPPEVRMFNVDVRKRSAENVFRKEKPNVVIHMATVTHLTTHGAQERQRINLGGTRAVFERCDRFGVEHLIFVGRHTYYGAAPDSPLYHTEDEPPSGVMTYPELADLIAADLFAGSALWRFPNLKTSVLRMVYTLGPTRHGTLANFMRGPRVPTVMGFDPLFQFMHELDVVSAICATMDHRLNGVFNVAGPQPVPLSLIVDVTGRQEVALPEKLFMMAMGKFGMPRLSAGAMAHVKFPVIVDSSAFRAATGWDHTYDEVQAMESFRWS